MLCVDPPQPVTDGDIVQAVTAWARIPCDEQVLVPGLLAEALDFIERETNRVFQQRPVTQSWDCWPRDGCLELGRWPVASVESIELCQDGAWVDDDLDEWNLTGIERCTSPRIHRKTRPTFAGCATGCDALIKSTFKAGYHPLESGPPVLMRALRLHVAESYRFRESNVTGTIVSAVPDTLRRVIQILKRHQIGSARERCDCLEV